MSWERSIITSKAKKDILKVLSDLRINDYSLRAVKGKKIKINLNVNLETCRKIINYLEE
jgi:hypothetical protein